MVLLPVVMLGLSLTATPQAARARQLSPDALPEFDALAGYPALAHPHSEGLADPTLVRPNKPLELEPRFGVPSFLWATPLVDSVTPRQAGATPGAAAKEALSRYASIYGLSQADVARTRVTSVHDLGQGAVIVRLGQAPGGVPLFNQSLAVIMDHELRTVALSGYLTTLANLPARKLSAQDATARAMNAIGHPVDASALHSEAPLHAGELAFSLTRAADGVELLRPARVRAVTFALPDRVLPAWHVELYAQPSTRALHEGYSIVISAVDGALLARHTQVQSDVNSYRVWAATDLADGGTGAPFDSPYGDGFTPNPSGDVNTPYHPDPLASVLTSLDHGPTLLNDPWLPSGATETVGNNVDAYVDLQAPNGYSPQTGDFRASVTSPATFDRSYDFTLDPQANQTQQMAAITQLFYDVNYFHDWYYGVGFDEAHGNGQTDNYGRGGVQGDALHAEAQDYSGTSNSNMYTPSDGSSPVMQMYIWTGEVLTSLAVNAPANVAGSYVSQGATFGPQTYDVSGALVSLDTSNADACNDLSSADATAIHGNIALINRGTCTFISKVEKAQAAGAIGVVIVQNTADAPFQMVDTDATLTIPAQMVGRLDGANLRVAHGVQAHLTQSVDVNRDGDFDNQIVAHEWGHYISNRLIQDAHGLDTNMSEGMGEGWADFHAMLLTVKAEDVSVAANADWAGTYSVADFVSVTLDPLHAFYWGIRREPYSTDMTKNGLTFADIQEGHALNASVPMAYGADGVGNSEVHATGEVWCTMLWEAYASLLRQTPDRYDFLEAQTRMRTYLIGAYEATPASPTFLDARDALEAVVFASDAQDFAGIQAAFAKRGAGLHAISPDRYSEDNVGVVEDYEAGNDMAVTSVSMSDDIKSCDHDGILDVGESGNVVVTLQNVGGAALTQTTARVTSTDPNIHVDSPAVPVPATFPFNASQSSATVKIPVTLSGASGVAGLALDITLSDPALNGGQTVVPFNATGNFDVIPASTATDTVEAPTIAWAARALPGSVIESDGQGHSQTVPLDTSVNWTRIASSATNHRLFGVDDDQPSMLELVSPPLDVGSRLRMTFDARWNMEVDDTDPTVSYDGAVMELSADDGGTWTDIGENATVGTGSLYGGALYNGSGNLLGGRDAIVSMNPSWPDTDKVALDLGETYANQTVKVRFLIGSDAAASAYGLELDNLSFQGITNTPFDQVVPDRGICEDNPPQAKIVAASTVRSGDTAILDGSGSVSTHGTALTFHWTQLAGPPLTLVGNGTTQLSYVAPDVSAPTQVQLQLVVNDGVSNSPPAVVTMSILHGLGGPLPVAPPKESAPSSGCGSTSMDVSLLALGAALMLARRKLTGSR